MVAGHICLDITPRIPQSLKGGFVENFIPGKLVNIDEAVVGTGGAVSNTGLAMAKLGAEVVLNAKVGDDAFGMIVKQLVGKDRTVSFRTVAGQCTSYSIVLAMPGIDRIFLHHPGTNDTFGADDIDYDSLAQCRLFHFGYPPLMRRMYAEDGKELVEMFKRVKALNVITSLDMTLPDPSSESGRINWRTILSKVLPYVDIFVPSIEESAFMADRNLFQKRKKQAGVEDAVLYYQPSDCMALSDAFLSMGTKIVMLKNGIRGNYLRTANEKQFSTIKNIYPMDISSWHHRELWAASFKADKFGSSTGAGDATIAGFLCGLLRGLGPVECLQVANTVGWENVREMDTLSGIEDWQTTLDLARDKNRSRNPLNLSEEGWWYCKEECIFCGTNDR